jgi:hypothetical protein
MSSAKIQSINRDKDESKIDLIDLIILIDLKKPQAPMTKETTLS